MSAIRDIGIWVDVPWHIRCPLVNRFFNTCLVRITCTTFLDMENDTRLSISKKVRIPFEYRELDIRSEVLRMAFSFPKDKHLFGRGVHVRVALLDVNHRRVFDNGYFSRAHKPITGCFVRPKTDMIYLGDRIDASVDIKFAKRDFKEFK